MKTIRFVMNILILWCKGVADMFMEVLLGLLIIIGYIVVVHFVKQICNKALHANRIRLLEKNSQLYISCQETK